MRTLNFKKRKSTIILRLMLRLRPFIMLGIQIPRYLRFLSSIRSILCFQTRKHRLRIVSGFIRPITSYRQRPRRLNKTLGFQTIRIILRRKKALRFILLR